MHGTQESAPEYEPTSNQERDLVAPYSAQKIPHQNLIVGVDPSLMPQRPAPVARLEKATNHHFKGRSLTWYSVAWKTVRSSIMPVITMRTADVVAIQSQLLIASAFIQGHRTPSAVLASFHHHRTPCQCRVPPASDAVPRVSEP